jgi:hypothetical protein
MADQVGRYQLTSPTTVLRMSAKEIFAVLGSLREIYSDAGRPTAPSRE